MDEWGESIRWVRPTCRGGREQVRYTERLARSMGSDDDMFRIWSGPEGSSHKEPLSGIRIHRVRRRFLVPRLPASAGRALGVSLVLGFACGIARLPSALPGLAGSQPKPPEGSHLSEELNLVLFAARWRCLERGGYVVQEMAALPFVFSSKEARFPGLGKRPLFVSWLVDWRRQ